MIKTLTHIMDRCRRFIINKLDGIPREDGIKHTVEYVTYPTIKLAREYECSWSQEMIDYVEKELAREFGIYLLKNHLFQIRQRRTDEGNVVIQVNLEVVDKRDKSI